MATRKTHFDYERALMLFNIIEKVANVHPQYMAISGEASAELKELNDALAKEQADRKAEEKRKPAADPIDHHPHTSIPVDHIAGTEGEQGDEQRHNDEADEAQENDDIEARRKANIAGQSSSMFPSEPPTNYAGVNPQTADEPMRRI